MKMNMNLRNPFAIRGDKASLIYIVKSVLSNTLHINMISQLSVNLVNIV